MPACSSPTQWIVIGLGFVLDNARRTAGVNQIDRFTSGLNTEREEFIEVEGSGCLFRADLDFFLNQYRTGINALVYPEPGDAGLFLTIDQGPVNRTPAAVFG